jgi:hypothetical protein
MLGKRVIFVAMSAILYYLGCATMQYAKTDHFDGNHFHNLDPKIVGGKNLFQVIKWRLTTPQNPWAPQIESLNSVKPALFLKIKKNECAITWINHATELIQFEEFTVLTDPIFSERASPVSWFGPKRVRKPGLSLQDLPKIDVVTISHNHYDHLDLASIKRLWEIHHPLFIVPLGNVQIIRSQAVDKTVELDWWQSYRFSPDHLIISTLAQHWSLVGPWYF